MILSAKQLALREYYQEIFKEWGTLDNNLQNVFTPYDLCEKMIDKVCKYCELKGKKILVTNLEFAIVLIERGIDPKDICFLTDCEQKAKFGQKIGVEIMSDDFFDFFEKVQEKKEVRTWDAVIMNPPYHLSETDSERNTPIYHKFAEMGIEITKGIVACLSPSRWVNDERGLNGLPKKLKESKSLRSITHFSQDSGIFKDVLVRGGTSFFVFDKNYKGDCELNIAEYKDGEIAILGKYFEGFQLPFVTFDAVKNVILDKVLKKMKHPLSDSIYPINAFLDKFSSHSDIKEHISSTQKEKTVKLYHANKSIKYAKKDIVKNGQLLKRWKVCTSKAASGAYMNMPRKQLFSFISEPDSGCTESYLVLHDFSNEQDAKMFQSYVQTKFFRFMLSLGLTSHNLSSNNFSLIPSMDEIKSVSDVEIYKQFDFSEKEIKLIDKEIL